MSINRIPRVFANFATLCAFAYTIYILLANNGVEYETIRKTWIALLIACACNLNAWLWSKVKHFTLD